MQRTESFVGDPIGRTVATLDLRNSKTYMVESRRQVLASASARKASPRPTFAVGSPAAGFAATAAASPAGGAGGAGGRGAAPAPTAAVGAPAEAAAALAYFTALSRERDALAARVEALEAALVGVVGHFGAHAAAVEASYGPCSQYYVATFGAGHIGMILTADADGGVEVAELRDDADTGAPLLAKASGKVAVGDTVLAVNDHWLGRHGAPTPDEVAAEFRSAHRPLTVLFKRNGAARLAALV